MGTFSYVLLACGIVLAAFYISDDPLPPGLEHPIRFKIQTRFVRFLIEEVSKVAELLGIEDMRIVRRNLILKLGSPIHFGKNPDGVHIDNATFGGVNVVVFTPPNIQNGGLRKGLLYVHGGGYLLGDTTLVHPLLSKMAVDTDAVIVSANYRLSPEHPTPAAFEDCLAVSRHFFAKAEDMGVDPKRIGVFGDSAGGNMAAVLTLKLRDEGGDHQFAYQLLIYPWMQAMDFRLPSYLEQDPYLFPDMKQKGMVLYTISFLGIDRKHIPKFQKNQHVTKQTRLQYSKYFKLGTLSGYEPNAKDEEPEVDEELAREVEPLITNPYNFPLMAERLNHLPPALVITVGIDTIRDDGLLYLERLREAGVEVEHYHDDICWHAAFSAAAVAENPYPCSVRLVDSVLQYIKKQK